MSTVIKSQFVSGLTDKEPVDSLFLVKDKFAAVGKTGKSYLGFRLSDSSGSVDSRIWERADEMNPLFESGQIVKVKGVVQLIKIENKSSSTKSKHMNKAIWTSPCSSEKRHVQRKSFSTSL